MAQTNSSTTLSANFKEIYGDGVDNVIPSSALITKEVPFSQAYKVGDKYIVPVMLSHEHGVTYLGQNNSGTTTLNNPIAAEYKEAQVDPSGTLLRSSISYSAADKMMSTKQAFVVWSSMLVENMTASIVKRNEIDFLYGQSPIGTISSVTNPGAGTTCDIVVTAASWADAIWAGMEGCELDVFNAALNDQVNDNAAIVITAVDFDTRTISVSGNNTDLTALFALTAASPVLFFRGQAVDAGASLTYNCMAGIHRILTNTSTLFNVSAGTYKLWKGTEYDVGSSALTLGKTLLGVGRGIAKGLDQDVWMMVNPLTFASLNSDQSALRRYGAERVAKNGFEYLSFYSGNGLINIVTNIYCKQGDAFAIVPEYTKRIGSTDVTFKLPNADPDQVFLHRPENAAYELRCRSEQAIFLEKPAQCIYFKNIVNPS